MSLRWLHLAVLLLALLLAACSPIAPLPEDGTSAPAAPSQEAAAESPASSPAPEAVMLEPSGFVTNIHDPVIAREGDTYYVFSTGSRIIIICSPDMLTWEFCGRVFERYPVWTREVNPNLADAWAPDISFFNGKWHLYYAISTFGSQESAIGLATSPTLDPAAPDYGWVDQGLVLRSHWDDLWNAIDPALVLDEAGEPWLAWGSFWHGIFLRKIDPATGLFAQDSEAIPLADRSTGPRDHKLVEAPFLVKQGEFWYLFTSFDQCCQGAASNYNVRVGRSAALAGPYVDRDGTPLLEGGGTLILDAYDNWKGPGHNGMLVQDGIHWMVYHAYNATHNGIPELRIESINWDADGWASLPSQ
ncbi:MAG: arabinan endo-1,5-alpha-L-arabinosidase, partial [Caldilineaceae bacterium]